MSRNLNQKLTSGRKDIGREINIIVLTTSLISSLFRIPTTTLYAACGSRSIAVPVFSTNKISVVGSVAKSPTKIWIVR